MQKKTDAWIILLVLLISLSIIAYAADPILIDKIIVESDSVIVPVGKTINVKTSIEPKNATSKKLEWSSSDESIMSVKNGTIKGVSCGNAIATATASDSNGVCISINVTVIQPVKKILFTDKKINLAPGTYHRINWTVEPENASIPLVSWSSSNEKVATVDDTGIVTGISKGNANIIATSIDGSKIKSSISVKVDEYDLVFVSKRPQKFKYWYSGGGNISIRGSVKNGNVSIPDISVDMWTSRTGGKTNESVEVTPLQPGTDILTIKVNNKKLDASIYVADYFAEYDVQPVDVPDTSPYTSNGSFRDIIYGTPYSEIKDQLIELYGNDYSFHEGDTGLGIVFNNPDISVAGHNVISLGLSFCYDQDVYGYIDSDEKSTSFYQARYIVSSQKNDSIAEDLYNKLCSLYGKASSDFGSSSNYTWHDNDISIYLDNSTDVSMLYSWGPGRTKLNILTGTKQYLIELEEQKKKDEMQKDNNYDPTTDGL